MSGMPTPKELAEVIGPEKIQVLKESCPMWVSFILKSNTWREANNIKFQYDEKIRTHGNCRDDIVGECFGFSDSYRYERRGCNQSEAFNQISLDVYNLVYKLKNYEYRNGSLTGMYIAFEKLCDAFVRLANCLITSGMYKSRLQKAEMLI